jgi:peptide/nickel transport system substrate-binding protein
MVSRYTKLRLKRKIRHQQQTLEQVSTDANKNFEYHVVRRWRNLKGVQRFVAGWLLLVFLLGAGVYVQSQNLSAFYQTNTPVKGGTYREGLVGEYANFNPIYASTSPDRSAAKLMFSSLLEYDQAGELVGDLATDWTVSEDGTVYTVNLKQNVKWHDGADFTAEDVVFTYKTIQNPDVRSVLNASWQGIQVQAKDKYVVTFTLPNSFTPFPHSLAKGGIIPKHILQSVNPEKMRSNQFNSTEPIGTGPYEYVELATAEGSNQLRLQANEEYFLGEPNINQIYLSAYPDQDSLINDFNGGELAAIGGLKAVDYTVISDERNHVWHDSPLTNGIFLFMKNSDDKLQEKSLRVALTQAVDRAEILKNLNGRFVPIDSALLKNQIGYDEQFTQAKFDPQKSQEALDSLGWKKAEDGWRYRDSEKLTLTITTQNNDYYPQVAEQIKSQLAAVGVNIEIQLVDESAIRSNHVIPHNYQLFLSGIEIGRDPDVFVFWHSSQAGIGGFNLSEYKSDVADASLESGRTRSDEELRDLKYQPFVQAWAEDAPAIGLYQPTYVYVQQTRAKGFESRSITTPEERFNNVHEWFINSEVQDRVY